MVLPLRPARFYGSSLPRPFIYGDVKFNSERVDPPLGVTEPFMSWAKDAHWSMGGINLKRKRMQGKIEGSVKKLRGEEEKETKIRNRDEKKAEEEMKRNKKRKTDKDAAAKDVSVLGSPKSKGISSPKDKGISSPKDKGISSSKNKGFSSPKSPPVASKIDKPIDAGAAVRRVSKRKWSALDEDDEGDLSLAVPESEKPSKKRSPRVRIRVRKLGDVFNQQAMDGSDAPGGQGIESNKAPSVALQATKKQAGKIMNVYDYVPVPDRVMKATTKRVSPRKNPGKSPASKVSSPVDHARRSSRLSLTPSASY